VIAAAVAMTSAAPDLLGSPFGVNAHIPPPEVLDAIAASGARWVRIDVLWSAVEPAPGSFHWDTYDALADQALARGLRLYATVSDTPAWATDGPPGRGVPRDSADWYDICFRAASRYRGRIDYWGMWNEPNDPRSWAGGRDEYIDVILKPGGQAVHAANPAARVCGPELAHLQSLNWDRWLRDVLGRASGDLDVVTHHLYPDGGSSYSVVKQLDRGSRYPWDPPSVRKVLQDNGWSGRPFWLTEAGCGSGAVGEAAQAAFVSNLLADLFGPQRAVSWVDRVFLYEINDDPRYPAGFGLLGPPPAYAEKAAYGELQRVAAAMPIDDAEIVRVELPRWLPPSAAARGVIEVRNTGTTTWSFSGGYRLAAGDDDDPFTAIRHDLDPGETVAPGATRAFAFDVAAPAVETIVGQPLESDWRMVREGRWRFGEIALARIAVSLAAPGEVSYLPFAMGLVDGLGRVWSSDVVLHNRGAIALAGRISLLVPGGDNEHARGVSVIVAPGASLTLTDVVTRQLGIGGRGVLRVDADSGDLLAGCTTAVSGGAGRYAAFTRGEPGDSAVTGGDAGRLLRLAHDADGSSPHSDLLLLNPAGEATTVDVDLLDDAGSMLGQRTYALAPFAVVYREDVLGEVAAGAIAHGQAVVRPASGAAGVLAWTLTSDLRSGDPTIAAVAVPTGEPFILAPAGGASRLRGGAWRTDVQLFGAGGGSAAVTLTLLTPAGQTPRRRDVELAVPGGAGIAVEGALDSLFGFRGAGALLVTPRSSFVAAAGGTSLTRVPMPFGQAVAATPVSRAVGDGGECRLFPITRVKGAGGARTHLGLVNLSAGPIVVTAHFIDANGLALRLLPIRLAGGEWQQVADVLKAAPTINGQNCYAVLRTATPGGRFLAYATVVDGATGDPMTVPCI